MWMVTADVKAGAKRLVLPSFLLKTFFGEGQNASLRPLRLALRRVRIFVLVFCEVILNARLTRRFGLRSRQVCFANRLRGRGA